MNDELKNILNDHNNFNLKKFYLENQRGAIIIITPKQTICNIATFNHCEVAEKILMNIYSDFTGFQIKKEHNAAWQYQILNNKPVICIQLCSAAYSIIWLPPKINQYQYSILSILNAEIERLNLNIDKTQMQIEFVSNFDSKPSNNINKLLKKLKNNIGELSCENEILIDEFRYKKLK